MQNKSMGAMLPIEAVIVDQKKIKPQWFHPYLLNGRNSNGPLRSSDFEALAYDYYLRFLPFFRMQPEGSIGPGVVIEFSGKMKQKLGLALLFEHKIRLNRNYFAADPALLPYTLFHEMTHIWLYDCDLDPGHTRRFYKKMEDFTCTGLPEDPSVHIHSRIQAEGRFKYACPNCHNRWYLRERIRRAIFCGHCFERENVEYYAHLMSSPLDRASGSILSLTRTRALVSGF